MFNAFPNKPWFLRVYSTSLLKTLENETKRNEQFILFPVFSTCLDNFLLFPSNLKLLSVNSLSLEV